MVMEIRAEHYNHIIEESLREWPTLFTDIDEILGGVRHHIKTIDERVFARRNDLLIAIRLVEAFRIFNWVKVCLACGSYHAVFRELRFMLDGVAQACYIDLNHPDAPLACKLEVYKALGDIGGFIGGRLFDRIRDFPEKEQLKRLYKELSRYVHPSDEESRRWIESPPSAEVVDSLKYNRFDRELLSKALTKCHEVGTMLLSLNSHFVKNFLEESERLNER
jgi:hypothetical protein